MTAAVWERVGIILAVAAGVLGLKLDAVLPSGIPRRPVALILIGLLILGGVTGLLASFQKERERVSEKNEHKSERREDQESITDLKKMTEDVLLIVSGNTEGDFGKEFPLGYSILAISGQKTFVPYESPLRGDYVVRWETAEVSHVTDTDFELRVPDFKNTITGNYAEGVSIQIKREAGLRVPAVRLNNVGMYAKVLTSTKTGVLVLIGLRQLN